MSSKHERRNVLGEITRLVDNSINRHELQLVEKNQVVPEALAQIKKL